MELIYAMRRKPQKMSGKIIDCLNNSQTLCTISSANVIAFTTTTELDDLSYATWGSHVYVVDLNLPWNSYKVASNKHQISALEWDIQGRLLLVADIVGYVQIYSPKDNQLNDWTLSHSAVFPGEHIIKAAFFHNGRKVILSTDKKEQVFYSDKFQYLRFAPSVKQFGSVPAEGALVLSTTGMLGSILITSDQTLGATSQNTNNPANTNPGNTNIGSSVPEKQSSASVITDSVSLGLTRDKILTLDMCYGKNGHFLIAVSSGLVSLPIQCYRVSIKKTNEKLKIISQALPSFFLRDSTIKDTHGLSIIQLRWISREDADSLVVAANSSSGCLIEVWGLLEKSQTIHNAFHQSTRNPAFKTVLWQHQSNFQHNSQIASVATSKLLISPTAFTPSYIIIALTDNSIHCLLRDTLKQISSTRISCTWKNEDSPSKQMRFDARISCLDISWLGNVLLAIDTYGQLHLHRLLPLTEPGTSVTVTYATTLLEYCIITGFDWLDLLLILKPQTLDAICDRLTESYNRQPVNVQQYYYMQYLCVKTSLFRLTMTGQLRAYDLSSLLMLHSVSTAFKGLLRPSDLSSHDKGPAESLALVISENLTDVDKVLIHLEAKEFTVEPSTLQSLQTLIQWVADLSLNLLSRVPESRAQTGKLSGYEITKDMKALNMLRELLVIIRIWGLLRPHCLPVFTRSQDNLDTLALLFKLLSKLVQNPNESDDSFLDECCLLPSQVLIPQLHSVSTTVGVASPGIMSQSMPINMEYGTEPEILPVTPELPTIEGGVSGHHCVDSLRHLHLGQRPWAVKQCTRCGANSSPNNTFRNTVRTAAVRAWEQRWFRSCRYVRLWSLIRRRVECSSFSDVEALGERTEVSARISK